MNLGLGRIGLRVPLVVMVVLALLGGCRGDGGRGAGDEPAAHVAQTLAVSGNFNDFTVPPTVIPNNNNHNSPYGFSVFWVLGYALPVHESTFVPTMTVPGAKVSCKGTLPTDTTCDAQYDHLYCRCDVEATSPNTQYTYTVHYNNNYGSTESATFTATTTTSAPLVPPDQNAAFSFLFFSDPHGHQEDMPLMSQVAAAMAAEPNVSFGVGGGDMGEEGDSSYQYLFNTYGATNSAGLLSTLPFYMAVGNHDWWGDSIICASECNPGWPRLLMLEGGDPYGSRDLYGSIGPGMAGAQYRVYSFDYGNSHFAVLDTGMHSRFDVGGTWAVGTGWVGPYDLDTAQLNWVNMDLLNAAGNPRIKHKFVILHEPPYDTQGDMKELISNPDFETHEFGVSSNFPILENLMQSTGVEMVLAGHRHHYEHLLANGIHYVTCSGSANVDSGTSADDDSNAQVLGYVGNSAGYCRIDVNGPDITVSRQQVQNPVDSSGPVTIPAQTVDQFTLGPPVPKVTAVNLNNDGLTNQFTIWWLDDSATETYYEITRSLDPTFQDSTTIVLGDPTDGHGGAFQGLLSYVDEGPYTASLAPNTTVYYRVRAWYQKKSLFSAPSVGSATTPSAMVAVTGLKATSTAAGVQLSWSSSANANYYEVERMGCSSHVTCTGTSCPAPPSNVCGYLTINPETIPGTPPATWPAPTSYLDANPTCANVTYRVRAWLSPFLPSAWSDEVNIDLSGQSCGPVIQRIGGVSPSTIKLMWSNDAPQGAAYGGNVIVQSSPDGSKWTTLASAAQSATAGSGYQVQGPSSCNGAASTFFRVGNYDANGQLHYSPAALAAPSQCMGTPSISAVAGGNTLSVQVAYTAPPGTPAPDSWVLYRRITGEAGFGTARSFRLPPGTTTLSESDPDVNCETSYDYVVRGFYSGGTSYFPDGAPTELSNVVTVQPSCGPCANGKAADQIFSPGMVGCGGAVTWDQRDTLCAPGYTACTAAEWAANGSAAPADDYWTADNLGYSPGPNGGVAGCQADTRGGYACPTNQPMRVCTSGGGDRYGNACNWTGCGLNGSAPDSFGGCYGNATAGTLCCRRTNVCGPNATSTQTFAPGVAGCGGHVTWDQRSGLCGKGCSACSAAEFQQYSARVAPTHDYWTNDNLGYGGSGSNACTASASGSSCGTNTPMRVCTPSGSDAEGNVCNWTGCTFSQAASGASYPPNPYFGGCVGDTTAGTVCCCDR